jgi:serine/threonine-protein kinase
MIAIVVAILVVLCSGVISYYYRKGKTAADPGLGLAPVSVTSGAVRAHGGDDLVRTSYRRGVRLQPAGGETTTSEGRQTR